MYQVVLYRSTSTTVYAGTVQDRHTECTFVAFKHPSVFRVACDTPTRGPPEADKGWTGILADYEMDQFSNEISVRK